MSDLAVSLSTARWMPTAMAPRGSMNGSMPSPACPDRKYFATEAKASSGHAFGKTSRRADKIPQTRASHFFKPPFAKKDSMNINSRDAIYGQHDPIKGKKALNNQSPGIRIRLGDLSKSYASRGCKSPVVLMSRVLRNP